MKLIYKHIQETEDDPPIDEDQNKILLPVTYEHVTQQVTRHCQAPLWEAFQDA